MRVSKQKAAEHREQIVRAATRLFREQGFSATGVDSITRHAGLTHGAVYSQFGSKEAIAIESVRSALEATKRVWHQIAANRGRGKVLPAIVGSYLSPSHRDNPGSGCLVAALGADISRQPKSVRDAFTQEFKKTLEFLMELVADDDSSMSREEALTVFASMAGALMLSRAVTDEALSECILHAMARSIETRDESRRRTQARRLLRKENRR